VTDGFDDGWLVVVDPQVVFADPASSPWGSPMWADVVPARSQPGGMGRSR